MKHPSQVLRHWASVWKHGFLAALLLFAINVETRAPGNDLDLLEVEHKPV
jgi:hypothetical protein